MQNTSSPDLRVTVLVGGTNTPSNAATLAESFAEGVRSVEGMECSILRLADLSLHHFTLSDYDNPATDDDFPQLQQAVMQSCGVVLATPVWNFSVPAHMKNAIDRMGSFALDASHSRGTLGGKPFAILFTGGAPVIAWKALLYLTTLHVAEAIKYYGGSVVFRHFEPKCVKGRGVFGLVVDTRPESLKRMYDAGKQFGRTAAQFQKTGRLPLGNRLWRKWFEFLYRVGNRIMYPLSTQQ